MAYVKRTFSPLSIEFQSEKEWKEFRSFLHHTVCTMDDRRRRPVFSREFNDHEGQVYQTIRGILEKTQ